MLEQCGPSGERRGCSAAVAAVTETVVDQWQHG